MPPWVARQWHVWGCSRSVSSNLCRSQRFRASVNLRFYAQSSTQDGERLQLSTANSAIIIPSSVANTRPEDLISHIRPVDKNRLTRDRFAVFFLTPSFATWLQKDQVFLEKALRQAYAHILEWDQSPYARIHALCAVVDKLPVPRPIADTENKLEEVFERIKRPPVQETGHEGIAYATLRFSDSIPTFSSTTQDTAAISFVTSEGTAENGGHFSDVLRLPLANTVFQTGSPTTMTYSTWEKARGANQLTLRTKRDIFHHGIKMQQGGLSEEYIPALSVPLVPLSMPRQVEASMGNILRRITGPDGKSMTASQELEQIVPRYFNARGEPSQATTVWALVMDSHNLAEVKSSTILLLKASQKHEKIEISEDKLWEHLWRRDPPFWSTLVSFALGSGARLHRVLSGGGGWGKKAGLLSLDPIPTAEADSSDDSRDFDMFDGPGDLSSALQQVAHDGDYVQFFISPSTATQEAARLEDLQKNSQLWGLELGTIPSTSDAMPVVPEQVETPQPNEVYVFRHTFGALAEGGMVISRNFKLRSRDSFSLIGGSTIDVPFSRFSAVSWTTGSGEEDVEEDSFRNCLEPKPIPYHRDLVSRLYGEEVPPFLGLHNLEEDLKGDLTSRDASLPVEDTLPVEETLPVENRFTKIIIDKPKIKYYTVQRDELAYCVDGLRRSDRKVARITSEYRTLMHEIRLQNGLRMDASLRKAEKKRLPHGLTTLMEKMSSDSAEEVEGLADQHRTLMNTVREQNNGRVGPFIRTVETGPPRGYIPWLEDATSESQFWVTRYQKDVDRILLRAREDRISERPVGDLHISPRKLLSLAYEIHLRTQRRLDRMQTEFHTILDIAVIAARADEISQSIAALHQIMRDMFARISMETHLAHTANSSAKAVYKLHIQLRWKLGAIIMTRKQHAGQNKVRRDIATLTEHLLHLRSFYQNLFVNRPHITGRYIRQRLLQIEKSHPVLKNLKLQKPLKARRLLSGPLRVNYYSLRDSNWKWEQEKGVREVRVGENEVRIRRVNKERSAVQKLEELVRGWVED